MEHEDNDMLTRGLGIVIKREKSEVGAQVKGLTKGSHLSKKSAEATDIFRASLSLPRSPHIYGHSSGSFF